MTRVSIPITEHVDDYDGDWQRALMGVVYATCRAAEVDLTDAEINLGTVPDRGEVSTTL